MKSRCHLRKLKKSHGWNIVKNYSYYRTNPVLILNFTKKKSYWPGDAHGGYRYRLYTIIYSRISIITFLFLWIIHKHSLVFNSIARAAAFSHRIPTLQRAGFLAPPSIIYDGITPRIVTHAHTRAPGLAMRLALSASQALVVFGSLLRAGGARRKSLRSVPI